MKETTLCYLKRENSYLMLHRNKKENDENGGMWIGVGGKLKEGETPEECAQREIREETGLAALELNLRSVITFLSDEYPAERMYLFTSENFEGQLADCDEGELEWVPLSRVTALPTWEGDRIFLNKLQESDRGFFSLKLRYEGSSLAEAVLWEDGIKRIIR